MMNLQDKFHGLPTEPPPFDRRLYKAAKAPFRYLWAFLSWVGLPWLIASPFGFVAALVIALAAHNGHHFAQGAMGVLTDTWTVGVVWTFYIGVIVAIVKGIQGLR